MITINKEELNTLATEIAEAAKALAALEPDEIKAVILTCAAYELPVVHMVQQLRRDKPDRSLPLYASVARMIVPFWSHWLMWHREPTDE